MAYGHKAFRRIQISNVEGTPGTAEAATEVLVGTITQLFNDKVWHKPEQDRGVLALNYETPFQVSQRIELELEGELYDRLMVFIAANSIRGNQTPTQPDAMNEPNHYRWVYEPALTAPNTPDQTNGIDTFTVEYGDNVQAYEVPFAYTVKVEISGAVNEAIMVTWTIQGRGVTETTFTAALTAPDTCYFPFNLAKFYIDTSYAGLGGTQKSGMLSGFTWTFETMFMGLFAADGNYYFSALKEDRKKVDLELTYYRDGTNEAAEFDKFLAQTTAYIRIELIGEAGEMDSGQANPPYIWLDGAYKYTEYPALDDEDGTSVVGVSAETFYDTTASKMMTVTIGTTMDAFS